MIMSKKVLIILSVIAVLLLLSSFYFFFLLNRKDNYKGVFDDISSLCVVRRDKSDALFTCDMLFLELVADNEICISGIVYNDKSESKLIKICDSKEKYQYGEDVVSLKKLTPVKVSMKYVFSREFDYDLESVVIVPFSNGYLGKFIEEDINSIITYLSSNTITKKEGVELSLPKDGESEKDVKKEAPEGQEYIKVVEVLANSFDLCPVESSLFDSVEQSTLYIEKIKENRSNEEYYTKNSLGAVVSSEIESLFLCDSAKNLGYSKICLRGIDTKVSKNRIPHLNLDFSKVSFGNNISPQDMYLLKQLSYIYDATLGMKQKNSTLFQKYRRIDETIINGESFNESVLCALGKVYSLYLKSDKSYSEDIDALRGFLEENIMNIHSPICHDILGDGYDSIGIYIKKNLYSEEYDPSMNIYNRCSNLRLMISENEE